MPTGSEQPIPPPIWPMVDASGQVNDVWYRFFAALFARTGGSLGNGVGPGRPVDLSALQAAVTSIQTQVPSLQATVDDLGVAVSTADETTEAVEGLRSGLSAVASGLVDVQVMVATQQEAEVAEMMLSLPDMLALGLLSEDGGGIAAGVPGPVGPAGATGATGATGPAGPYAPSTYVPTSLDATGATDCYAAIQTSINACAAAGGGTVYLPIGTFRVNATLTILQSGVHLIGAGHGGPHDTVPNAPAGTKLIWGGVSGGTMLSVSPNAGAGNPKLTDVEVSGLCLDAGSSPAGIGLLVASVQNSDFDVFCTEFASAGMAMSVVSPLAEAANNEANTIRLCFRQILRSGTGLQLGGNVSVNTAHNVFQLVYGYINAGIGIDLQDSDNNYFEKVWIDRISGGTGTNLVFRGRTGTRGGARAETIETFSQSVHSGLILSEGTNTPGVTLGAYGNRINHFDNANVAITTSTGTGATFFWGSNLTGVGLRDSFTSVYDGRRQLDDGLIFFWGTSPSNFGAGSSNNIILPFGCDRIVEVSGNYVGTGNVAAPCIPAPTGNTFSLYSPASGIYTWRGYAVVVTP